MGFYLRCRLLQASAPAQADCEPADGQGAQLRKSRRRTQRNEHQATFANAAEFLKSLLGVDNNFGENNAS
jgi:hypothetical protein